MARKNNKPRIRKQPTYKSFRLSKKIKPSARKPLPGIFSLYKSTLFPLKNNKKLFFGILLIHFVLTAILVGAIGSSFDFLKTKDNLEQALGNDLTGIGSATTLLSYAVSSGASADSVSANYQLFLSLITSLAVIWAIRQVLAGEKVGIRQTFYQGVYPLVPFMVVLFVIMLQMIPALIGNFLLATVINNGLAITFVEKLLWWIIFILLFLLSLYMILSSVFGLYISTLPNMTPLKALRSARGLVLHRRLSVAIRLMGLPIIIVAAYALILVPLIFAAPILVVPAFLVLGSFNIFFINSYIYNLYRTLL